MFYLLFAYICIFFADPITGAEPRQTW